MLQKFQQESASIINLMHHMYVQHMFILWGTKQESKQPLRDAWIICCLLRNIALASQKLGTLEIAGKLEMWLHWSSGKMVRCGQEVIYFISRNRITPQRCIEKRGNPRGMDCCQGFHDTLNVLFTPLVWRCRDCTFVLQQDSHRACDAKGINHIQKSTRKSRFPDT